MTHRRLVDIKRYFQQAGRFDDADHVQRCVRRIERQVANRFGKFGNETERLRPPRAIGQPSRPEQMYRILEKKARRTPAASPDTAAVGLRWDLEAINKKANKELRLLASKYGPLEVLAARAGLTGQQAPMTVGPTATMATGQVTAAPPLQPVDPVPAPGSVSVPPPSALPRPETGASLPAVTELLSQPPGPSSRVMPSRAPRSPTAPAREVAPAQRKAIVERFRSGEALLHAGFTLGNGAADALGWAAARESAVLDDLHRLHTSAAEDPGAAAGPGRHRLEQDRGADGHDGSPVPVSVTSRQPPVQGDGGGTSSVPMSASIPPRSMPASAAATAGSTRAEPCCAGGTSRTGALGERGDWVGMTRKLGPGGSE